MPIPKPRENIPDDLWPPANSEFKEYTVYRLVKDSNGINSEDFDSVYKIHEKNGRIQKEKLCDDGYYGVSVFEDIDDLHSTIKKVQALKKHHKAIAEGATRVEDGIVRKDIFPVPTSHINWWLFATAAPEKYFVIKEVIDE